MHAHTLAQAALPLSILAASAVRTHRRGRWVHFDLVHGATVSYGTDVALAVADLAKLGVETKVLEGDGIWSPAPGAWQCKSARKFRRTATIKVVL
jgi:hypothetical protein